MNAFEKIVELLVEYKDLDAASITMDSTFETLNLDSLDIAEMAMNLEDDLGIVLELNESMKTVKDIVAAIEAAK